MSPNIGVRIRLQQTSFTVTEGVNTSVSICAEIYSPTTAVDCLVDFEFEIILAVLGGMFQTTNSALKIFYNIQRTSSWCLVHVIVDIV